MSAPALLFTLDRANCSQFQSRFRGERAQEYYGGRCWVEPDGLVEVRADRKALGPFSIIHLRSNSRLFFRRRLEDIRDDAVDLSILWFVARGGLNISDHSGDHVAACGDFALTRSASPFFMECWPDRGEVFDALHVTVPTPVLRKWFGQGPDAAIVLPANRRDFAIAAKLLREVFEDDDILNADTPPILVEAALELVANAIREQTHLVPRQPTLGERRLDDVLRFVEIHLCDPELSVGKLARECCISPRYLATLMHRRGTSLSKLIWGLRLEKARQWLSGSDSRQTTVSEIAFGLGFKSAAHFSRSFKKKYGVNPRSARS